MKRTEMTSGLIEFSRDEFAEFSEATEIWLAVTPRLLLHMDADGLELRGGGAVQFTDESSLWWRTP